MKQKLLFVFGTRPEAIKLFPVIRAAGNRPEEFQVRVCVTGQHRQMLDSILAQFGIHPDYDLDIMVPDQSLSEIASQVLSRLEPVLEHEQPDWMLVQGDTTTAMGAALAAFHHHVPVAHLEAGLRTWDPEAPFPEEMNRRVIGLIARMHFVHTTGARDNLAREGVPDSRILVTGNTGVDALFHVRDHLMGEADLGSMLPNLNVERRLILVTSHRRENAGEGLNNLCLAIRDIVARHGDVEIVFPVHLNPAVQEPVDRILTTVRKTGRLHLPQPVDYATFVALLDRCYLVLTDSGGLQEEAPSFGKPVLCIRSVTERPEGVEAGSVRMIGTGHDDIVSNVTELLNDRHAWTRMARIRNLYGDGQGSRRILDGLQGRSID